MTISSWIRHLPDRTEAMSLIEKLFALNPNKRFSAEEIANHSFFDEVRGLYDALLMSSQGFK